MGFICKMITLVSFHHTRCLHSDFISVSRESPKLRAWLVWTPGASPCVGSHRELNGRDGHTALPPWMRRSISPTPALLWGRGAWGDTGNGNGTHQELGASGKPPPQEPGINLGGDNFGVSNVSWCPTQKSSQFLCCSLSSPTSDCLVCVKHH